MADNEINIKCRICGKTFFLAKRFGLEGYYRNSKIYTGDLVNFLERHHACALLQNSITDDIFDVDYEVPPEWLKGRHELAAHYEKKLKEANERIEQLERIVDTYEQVQKEFFIDNARKEAEK